MKKTIFILLILAFGCKEEEPHCDCGVIVINAKFSYQQHLTVENNCTKQTKVFKEDFTRDYEVGEVYCLSRW
jgi:hypothetical protein